VKATFLVAIEACWLNRSSGSTQQVQSFLNQQALIGIVQPEYDNRQTGVKGWFIPVPAILSLTLNADQLRQRRLDSLMMDNHNRAPHHPTVCARELSIATN